MHEPRLSEQITSLHQVLSDTRKRELHWTETGTEGTYTSTVGRESALLFRGDDGLIVLQFMTSDRPDWTVRLSQLGDEAHPTDEETVRDGLLSLLFDKVEDLTHPERSQNSMARFTRKE